MPCLEAPVWDARFPSNEATTTSGSCYALPGSTSRRTHGLALGFPRIFSVALYLFFGLVIAISLDSDLLYYNERRYLTELDSRRCAGYEEVVQNTSSEALTA